MSKSTVGLRGTVQQSKPIDYVIDMISEDEAKTLISILGIQSEVIPRSDLTLALRTLCATQRKDIRDLKDIDFDIICWGYRTHLEIDGVNMKFVSGMLRFILIMEDLDNRFIRYISNMERPAYKKMMAEYNPYIKGLMLLNVTARNFIDGFKMYEDVPDVIIPGAQAAAKMMSLNTSKRDYIRRIVLSLYYLGLLSMKYKDQVG